MWGPLPLTMSLRLRPTLLLRSPLLLYHLPLSIIILHDILTRCSFHHCRYSVHSLCIISIVFPASYSPQYGDYMLHSLKRPAPPSQSLPTHQRLQVHPAQTRKQRLRTWSNYSRALAALPGHVIAKALPMVTARRRLRAHTAPAP